MMYDSSHLCDCWENPATNVIKLAVVIHVPPCLLSFAFLNSCKLLFLLLKVCFVTLLGELTILLHMLILSLLFPRFPGLLHGEGELAGGADRRG